MRLLEFVPGQPEKSTLLNVRVRSDAFTDFDIFGQNQYVWIRIVFDALFSAGEA